jgi:hypothetical protein
MNKPRLAIGDVYLTRSDHLPGWRCYTFEICGEVWVDGKRMAAALCHQRVRDKDPIVTLFNDLGEGTGSGFGGRFWTVQLSRAKPRYQRPEG